MSKKRNSKKSLVVLIASTFWIFYVLLTGWQYYLSADRAAETLIAGRRAAMDFVQNTGTNLLVNDNIPLFEDQMKHSRELFLTDFYILQKDGKVISYYNGNASADSLNVQYTHYGKLIETEKISFKSVRIFDYTLTVGITTNKPAVIFNILKTDYMTILKDILTVTGFLCLLLYLYLKDIINLSKILSSKDRSKIAQVSSISREGNALVRASQGFQAEQIHLKSENLHFSNTITPAILHEINSGTPAPYSFDSTMIRVDLNGYTQIFLEKREVYITQIMNSYFTQAREVIERYSGLVYQYVGDEIVFHIKNSQTESQALALACIRSLFEVAEQVEKNLPPGADHYFKIKCCFSFGKMRFTQLDTGYGLSGLTLIETARLLTQIEEKSKSSVCFYLDSHQHFDFLCKVDSHKPAILKGFQSQSDIAKTSTFVSIQEIFAKSEFKRTKYFRSNADLAFICQYFSENLSIENEDAFFVATGFIKEMSVRSAGQQLVSSFTNLLKNSYQRNAENWLSDKVLSTVIALAGNLIPASSMTSEISEILSECLNHRDHRVCANAILVLGNLSKNDQFLREFIHSANNRISADAMLVAGKRNFDQELAQKLENYILSKNPLFQASGLFVARELIQYYLETDPVFFEASEHLQRINDLLEDTQRMAA